MRSAAFFCNMSPPAAEEGGSVHQRSQLTSTPELLDAAAVARILGISKSAAYALMARLPHVRIGRSLRVRRAVLEQFVTEQEARCYPERHPGGSFDAPTRPFGGHGGPIVASRNARQPALCGKQTRSDSSIAGTDKPQTPFTLPRRPRRLDKPSDAG
ncbi:MAG: helix-turn-helix domain-containing protein [Candidatus Eisenbacteria bacterium]|nr:helix-turn-helix domain-containing protein [Candidatus Eisenbacteria bacterium]